MQGFLYFAFMQKRFLLCLLGFTAAFSFRVKAQDFAAIGGTFKNPSDYDMIINAYLYPLDLIEGNSVSIMPELDKSNNFEARIGFDRPFYVRYVNRRKLQKGTYVMPGDKIWLTVADGEARLTGSNKKLLTFLGKMQKEFENAELEIADTAAFKTMGRVQLMNYLKERRDRQLRYVIEYFIGLPPLDMQMKKLLMAEINYSFALKMLRYGRSAGRDKRFVFRYNDYMGAIEEVTMSDPEAMISTAYSQFIYELPYTLWHSEINWGMTDKPPYNERVANEFVIRDSMARKYFSGEVYELALYAILLDAVKDAAKAKSKNEESYSAAYMKANGLIEKMGKAFTNRLYYSRLKSKLEETQAPTRVIEEPKKKKPVKKR